MAPILFAGVDVRITPNQVESSWTVERRRQYLLREDIARPLSLDRNVWAAYEEREGQRIPDWAPWVDLEQVRSETQTWTKGNSCSFVLLMIGIAIEDEDDRTFAASQGIQTELTIDPTWTALGYDISDGSYSGVSNCGYDADDTELRILWGPRLNQHGLFDNLKEAFAFRALTNERVSEHAPFFVYGLWIVPRAG